MPEDTYDGHRDLLKLPKGRKRPMRIAYAVNPDARLSWGGLPHPAATSAQSGPMHVI
jgi:hypothetical protein